MAANDQSKVLFAALYAREFNKWQQFAKDFRRPNPFGGGQPSSDEPKMQGGAPWDNWPGIGMASGEQAWIASKAYSAALTALSDLQGWAEQAARVEGDNADPPNPSAREYYSDYTGISDTPPDP